MPIKKWIASKSQIKKERDPKKVEKVIVAKTGKPKLSKDKELHHIIPVAEWWKTTKKNTNIVSKWKHKQIHKNRRKIGKI